MKETLDTGRGAIVKRLLQNGEEIKESFKYEDYEGIVYHVRRIVNSQEVPDPKALDFRMFIYECLKLVSPVPVHLLNIFICFLFCNIVS